MAFAFGCADGSIHVYVQQTHEVRPFICNADGLTNFDIIRKITLLLLLPAPMEDPLKILPSSSLTVGLLAWVTGLCKSGS